MSRLIKHLLFSFLISFNSLYAQLIVLNENNWKQIPLSLDDPSNLILSYPADILYFDYNKDGKRNIASLKISDIDSVNILNLSYNATMPAPIPQQGATALFLVEDTLLQAHIYPDGNGFYEKFQKRKVKLKYPVFNQNGGLMAFSGKTINDRYYQLMTFDFKYDNLNVLTKTASDIQYPRWSADGKKISYHSPKTTNKSMQEITLVHWDGMPDRKVSNDSLSLSYASWGKSNTRFVCVGENQKGFWLLLYLFKENRFTELAFSTSPISNPVWSTNENKIVFLHQPRADKKELILLTID